ncbi:PLD-like domain protein [Synechococcus sp. A18-46.1]|nr:PLD-like domain protein [Synechococcus sp. A18-46.1]
MSENGLDSGFGHWSIPENPSWETHLKELHHKFAVIDNKTVITGSFNWSPSAAHTNDETLLVIHSPQLAKHFTREMDRLWNGAELGITPHIQRKLDRQKIRCGDGVERD